MDARNYRKRCGRCHELAPEREMVRIGHAVTRYEKVNGAVTRRCYRSGWWHKTCAASEGLRAGLAKA